MTKPSWLDSHGATSAGSWLTLIVTRVTKMRPRQLVEEGTPAAEGLRAVTDESLVPSRLVVEQDR